MSPHSWLIFWSTPEQDAIHPPDYLCADVDVEETLGKLINFCLSFRGILKKKDIGQSEGEKGV